MNQLNSDQTQQALLLLSKSNRLNKKRNLLIKKQIHQSELDYQQAERLYLIEKSKLQPSFKLLATEFLLNEPDFVNDPEHAMEANFLVENGFKVDQRVLRFKLSISGDNPFMRLSLVTRKLKHSGIDNKEHRIADESFTNDCLLSFGQGIFFIAVNSVDFDVNSEISVSQSFELYLVYQDQTTLPVVLKYCLNQQVDSTLLRWEVDHVDTVFVSSRAEFKHLDSSFRCDQLFIDSSF